MHLSVRYRALIVCASIESRRSRSPNQMDGKNRGACALGARLFIGIIRTAVCPSLTHSGGSLACRSCKQLVGVVTDASIIVFRTQSAVPALRNPGSCSGYLLHSSAQRALSRHNAGFTKFLDFEIYCNLLLFLDSFVFIFDGILFLKLM